MTIAQSAGLHAMAYPFDGLEHLGMSELERVEDKGLLVRTALPYIGVQMDIRIFIFHNCAGAATVLPF